MSTKKTKILKSMLPKHEFEKMTPDDRVTVILFSHMLTELNSITRLLLFSSNGRYRTDLEKHLSAPTNALLTRILIGRLYSAWELVEKTIHKGLDSRRIKGLLNKDALEALDYVNKYYGRSGNIIKSIRNNFAFHTATNDKDFVSKFERYFRMSPVDDDWSLYITEGGANRYLMFAENVYLRALIGSEDEQKFESDFGEMIGEVLEVDRYTRQLFENVVVSFWDSYDLMKDDLKKVHGISAGVIGEVTIPVAMHLPPKMHRKK